MPSAWASETWRANTCWVRLRKAHGVPDTADRARRGADADSPAERLYFWFGDPIDATRFGTRYDDTTAARALRDEVKQAILVGIQFLRDQRDQDPSREVLKGYAAAVTSAAKLRLGTRRAELRLVSNRTARRTHAG